MRLLFLIGIVSVISSIIVGVITSKWYIGLATWPASQVVLMWLTLTLYSIFFDKKARYLLVTNRFAL